MKDEILKILRETLKNREGIEDFLYYLEKGTDFFEAPCSTMFHLSRDGGLAEHSMNVYNLLKEKVERFELEYSQGTIALCALMHDICKTNFYKKGKKWTKPHGKWVEIDCYEVDDQFPTGHGEKSVFILQRFFKLSDDEIMAIRWHMAAFDASIHFNYPNGYPFKAATKKCPLVTLLATADMEASNIIEKE